ncbi:hypothetical protein AHAS_Ahas03G0093100 [Arachis hypogaea]
MAFSPLEGGSISTLINPTQGDKQFSVGELDIQEQEGWKVCCISFSLVVRNFVTIWYLKHCYSC